MEQNRRRAVLLGGICFLIGAFMLPPSFIGSLVGVAIFLPLTIGVLFEKQIAFYGSVIDCGLLWLDSFWNLISLSFLPQYEFLFMMISVKSGLTLLIASAILLFLRNCEFDQELL